MRSLPSPHSGATRSRRARPSGVATVWLLALVSALLNASCAFFALRENLERMQRFATVGGTVDTGAPAGTPTVVVLFRSEGEEPVDSFVLPPHGRYFFVVPAGSYRIGAFIDTDNNFRYDPAHERGIWYRAPDVIHLVEGQAVGQIDLRFGTTGTVTLTQPLIAPELGRRGMRELPDVNIGTVTTIDDPRFSQENGTLGMWQPVDFAARHLAGIYLLEPFDPDKIPVLFVHGITGYPAEFRHLIARLDRKRFQPWLLYYPSGGRLEMLGRSTIRWITALGVQHRVRRLVIVAHSMGGLVSRSAINQWIASVGDARATKLDAFVTISTPWGGHAAAAEGVEHAPEVVPAWDDMAPGSEFLEGIFATQLPPECRYYLFFSYEGHSALVGGVNDGVVAVSSELVLAAQEQAVKVYGFPESHTSILRSEDVSARLNRVLADLAP